MKNKRWITALAAVICAVAVTGCTRGGEQQGSSMAPLPPEPEASSSEPAPPSSSSQQAESSEPAPVESLPPNPSQPPESDPVGQVVPVETDDKDFDALFQKNAIDKAYVVENNEAISTVDMLAVSEKYADIWARKCEDAYQELMKKAPESERAAIGKKQQAWKSGEDAAIKKIEADAQERGGSMAQVDAASMRMEYYRNRAAELYKELYKYDKNLTIQG